MLNFVPVPQGMVEHYHIFHQHRGSDPKRNEESTPWFMLWKFLTGESENELTFIVWIDIYWEVINLSQNLDDSNILVFPDINSCIIVIWENYIFKK
jgi:hypothetical protein